MSEPFIVHSMDELPPELGQPADPAALREAWSVVEARWAEAYEQVRPGQETGSVNGEWSLVQTLRHLMFATDAWVGVITGAPQPHHHPWGLPFTELTWDVASLGVDLNADPSYEEVRKARAEEVARVRDVLASVTAERLAEVIDGPVWEPGVRFSVLACIQILLNEEWRHLDYALRDLALIGASD